MEKRTIKKISKKIFSSTLIVIYTVTFILQDMKFSFAQSYGSTASAGNQFIDSVSTVQSFQPDLFTGRASLGIPVAIPPGRQGMQPNLALGYSSGGGNGWLGVGWGLDLGVISRSTKNGIPKYNSSDTFVFAFQGVSSELVSIGGQEYRAKDEGLFLKFIFNGTYWEIFDKSGTKYTFGTTDASRCINPLGTYAWHLDKTVDINGNYFTISYTKDQNQVYLSQIQYTGHEVNPIESPSYAVDFVLEARTDKPRDFRSGYEITTAQRLKEISIKLGVELVRKYVLSYSTSARTGKSLLSSITQYGSDGISTLPPITLSYHDTAQPSYNIYNKAAGLPYLQFAGDYNGDGRFDLAEFLTNGTWSVSLSQGSSFAQATTWITAFGDSSVTPLLGDFNGDAKTDICIFNSTTGDWRVATSTGTSFFNEDRWSIGVGAGLTPISGDFNGDGLTDVGTFNSSNGTWNVSLSSGVNFVPNGIWISSFGASGNKPLIGDFNGDGLTDVATTDASSGNINCALSDGTKFLTPTQWVSGFGISQTHVTSDFDNDGLTDVGYLNQSTNVVHYLPSTGFSFGTEKQISAGFTFQGQTSNLQTGDFNGDGLNDPALIRESDFQFQIAFSQGNAPDIIYTLNNGMGGSSTVVYEPSTSYDNTGGDGVPDLPFVIQTVKSLTVSDGMGNSYTTNYTYSGGKYNAATKDFLGFGYAKVTDANGTYSETYFKQDVCLKGKPYQQDAKDSQGNLYARTTNTYACVEPYIGVHYNQLTQTDSFIYDGDATYKQSRARFEYDSYGSVTTVYGDGEIPTIGDERKTVTSYTYNTSTWILGKPSKVTFYDVNLTKVSEKTFYYDGNLLSTDPPTKGNLTKEEVWLNTGPPNPTTSYIYDNYGNLTQATDALGRSITNTYDSTYHTYIIQVTNALGHTISYTYDYRLGVVLSTTDTNNVTSQTEYDVFGRKIKTIGPYDTQALPTVTYEYDLSTTPVKVTTNARETAGSSEVGTAYAFYDGLGRMIQLRTPVEDPTKQVVSGIATYTTRGEVKEKYLPFFDTKSTTYVAPNLTGKPKITYTYDAVGRVTQITSADSTYSTVQYSDWTQTTTDENGHQKRYTYDASGLLIKVEEFVGANIYTTTYEYDTQGNLIKVTDALSNITTISYDSLGRKSGMVDADMGTWSYSYDLIGNLTSQTDAKGQTINFQYDQLNRLILKDYTTGTDVTYTYDDPLISYSKGRLTKVTYSNGQTTFQYDKLGRETSSTKTIDTTSYTVQRTYDNLNRLTSVTYPDNEAVNYTYNATGAIEKVEGQSPQGTVPYVVNVDYSPAGQITKINYGNGTQTDYSYNSNNLRLTRITTKDPSLALLQDLLYSYDNVGNITTIQDIAHSTSQNFTYDDLDRLTSASGAYGSFSYSYNAIGNITYKEERGYSYLSAKPHAVTSLSDGTSFSYDANGNMIQKIEKGNPQLTTTYSYDYENRLIQATFPKPETATINLTQGWNFVSIPVIPNDNTITSMMPNFGQDIDQVSRYNSQADTFEHFVNDAQYNDFTTLDYDKGYEVYVKNPSGTIITIQGKVPTVSVSESLNQGSNLIPSATLNTNTSSWLANNLIQNTDYDFIWKYNKTTSSFESLTNAQSKESYFLHNIKTTPITWNIPTAPDNTITFAYDGDGGRVKKVWGSNTTIYVGSLYEVENGTPKKHIFLGGTRIATKTSTSTEYYHSDHLGGTNIITNSSGTPTQRLEYSPFGSTYLAQGTSTTNYKYTGKESDPTGLYYYGARYYDPELGRFIQADTYVQDISDPQSLNRYTYCRNNPLVYTDPTGHSWLSKLLKKVGDFFSGIVEGIKDNPAAAIGALVGGIAFGMVGSWVATSYLAPAFAAGGITAGEAAFITGIEFAIGGFGAGFVGTLAGGGSISEAFKAGGIGAGIGFITGGVLGYTYQSGMQDFVHGFNSREYNIKLYEQKIKVLRPDAKMRPDQIKAMVGARHLSMGKPDTLWPAGPNHKFIGVRTLDAIWEMGPDLSGKIATSTSIKDLGSWGTHLTTQEAIASGAFTAATTQVSASGLSEAIGLYDTYFVKTGMSYLAKNHNSNYAVNTVIYGAGGNSPEIGWAPGFPDGIK